MASPNWVSAFIQFYILTNLAYLTVTHGDNKCGTQGTYTKNSVYENNLNDTLSSLVKSPKGNLFFKNNSISGQETAYAIAFCRGDSQEESCVGCVKSATNRLREDCPNQKKATGWYYSTCILSYSNTTFEVVDDKDAVSFRTSSISNWDPVLKTLGKLFGQLRSKAATDGYYKTFYSGGMILQDSKDNIQANIQCIPDISRQKCEECLGNATNYLLTCCNGSGQVVVFYRYSCLLRYVIYLVSIDDPSTNPSAVLSPDKKSSNFIGPGIALAGAGVTLVISAIFLFIKIRRMCSKRGKRYYIIRIHHFRHNNIVGEGEEEEMFAASDDETGDMVYFRLNVIHAATSNFSVVNKLGEGGFGPVYWGKLSDGKKIAVKRLSQNSSQGLQEFKTEVKLIIKLQHKNLVRLLGCCMKRNERLLVYEYMSKSSLDKYLFDPKKAKELDWVKRVNIVSGIAKGLRYLHEDSRLKIIHRDLKASNVLLDEDMNPKISDFGTARIFGSNQIEANTDRVVGTYGYMAPEYAMEGLFSMKSDVYSFGVLLLEIISGKRNGRLFHEEHDQNLLSYAWMLWEGCQGERLIDANLNDDCPVDEALKWMRIALLCVEEDPDDRPTMSSVTCMLEGEWKTLSEPKPPVCFHQIITSDQSSSAWNVDEFGFYSSNETAQTGNSGQHKAIHYQGVQ